MIVDDLTHENDDFSDEWLGFYKSHMLDSHGNPIYFAKTRIDVSKIYPENRAFGHRFRQFWQWLSTLFARTS